MTNKLTHEVTLNDGSTLKVMHTEYGYWSDDLQQYIDARSITSTKAL